MHNETSKLVSDYKDFLYQDDNGEYLRKYYDKKESMQLIP